MFQEEIKKLFVKQYGYVVIVLLFIGEIIFTNILYPKSAFTNEFSEPFFNEYMTEFSGELTADKKQKILVEQERILNAANAEGELEARLYNGDFADRNEFRTEYNELHSITMRTEAFDMVLEKYYYALENPENHYILSGRYDGLGQDYPDILLLLVIIIMTAAAFLNEEVSNISTLIRTSENGRKSTFRMKMTALLIFIGAGQFIRMICEFFAIISNGNLPELSYPIQSILYFQNCLYSLTIAQCFLVISAMRLLGYIFIASLVMLLAVKIKKPLFTVFVPCSICLLQQFAFGSSAFAYCIPTRFLRASGYMRGDSEDSELSAIPVEVIAIVMIFTLAFVIISIVAAQKYYSPGKRSFKHNHIAFLAAVFIVCHVLSGCSTVQENAVVYNLCDNFFFAQNNDYYFISNQDGITRIGKSDDTEFQIIRDPFLPDTGLYGISICGNDLYCLDAFGSGKIKVISLNTLSECAFNSDKLSEYSVYSAFSNGSSLFFSTFDENGIYELRDNRIRKIISEKIYNNQLCFDGRKIFYVNSMLELVCFDTQKNESTILSEDFTRAVYYDGRRIVYSTDKGIFSLDNNTFSVVSLSEITVEKVCSDGRDIVFLKDGRLFVLGDDIEEIYSEEPLNFALIPNMSKMVLRQFDHRTNEYIDLFVDLRDNMQV